MVCESMYGVKMMDAMMDKYVCTICGYVYDPEIDDEAHGIAGGTEWHDLPEGWRCPVCGCEGRKDTFELF